MKKVFLILLVLVLSFCAIAPKTGYGCDDNRTSSVWKTDAPFG